jgi:hypothetical protein
MTSGILESICFSGKKTLPQCSLLGMMGMIISSNKNTIMGMRVPCASNHNLQVNPNTYPTMFCCWVLLRKRQGRKERKRKEGERERLLLFVDF